MFRCFYGNNEHKNEQYVRGAGDMGGVLVRVRTAVSGRRPGGGDILAQKMQKKNSHALSVSILRYHFAISI